MILSPACSDLPTDERPGSIHVRGRSGGSEKDHKERSFEEVWSNVVFELYNITNVHAFCSLDSEATRHRLSKEQYVVKGSLIESRAAEKARSYYVNAYLPWAKNRHIATSPSLSVSRQAMRSVGKPGASGRREKRPVLAHPRGST